MERQVRIALDSCVVIDLIEKKGLAGRLRAQLRGKHACIVLCDVVLEEVRRVRGLDADYVVPRIARLVGRRVEVSPTDGSHRDAAESITSRYRLCHGGDNVILALCRMKSYVLLTFDRMLLTACGLAGVPAFRPDRAGGI